MNTHIKSIVAAVSAVLMFGLSQSAQAGEISTQPWLQNVYTNRFTVMCETKNGPMDGLTLQYGADFSEAALMTCTNGLKEGTWIYTAQVVTNGAGGAEIEYRLATNEVAIAKTEGSVKLWKDEDAAFTCAIWGDNQEGVQTYDWGNDNTIKRYAAIRAMFNHMKKQTPDFGFSTGDFSSSALYDEEIEPGELNGADKLFGSTIPYHLVWGNHDCIGEFFGEVYTNAAQRYFAPAATEEDGWFHLYRNDVLFIGVHWTWGSDDAEARYDAITNGVAQLLKTDRAKNAKFRVLVQHAPIFLEVYNVLPKSDWFSDTRLLDVAKAGGVDLIFSGHTHAYERIEKDGLVQVVNGGMGYLDHGERWYNNYGSDTKVGGHQNTPLLWARQDENGGLDAAEPVRMGCFQGYGMLSVTNNVLTYKAHAFDANGDYIGVADSFSIESKTVESGEKGESGESVKPFTPTTALVSPVSNKNWEEFKKSQGEAWKKPAMVDDADPVVNVSKTEAERFCAALNEGKTTNYRLPTVAELTEIFEGNLERDVSEWTSDIDPDSGWCRILGGNKQAIDFTWCREYDKPAMASPDCHADYLGFRVIDDTPPVVPSAMDKALAKLAKIKNPSEVYKWDPVEEDLEDITKDWKALAWKKGDYDYTTPVIFTGSGDLKYHVREDVVFGGGLAAPNATSLDLSHILDLGIVSKPVTVKGEFRGGPATDDWHFFLKCDGLTFDNVTYRGQVFNAVTDDRTLNLVGDNDFSGAVMTVCVDKKLFDELFVTNLVADAEAILKLRRLDFSARGVVEEVLGRDTAGFTVGENVTLTTAEDVLFGIKGATLTVDGVLDAAGVNIAGHLLGLLPQTATVAGKGTLRTTHFGMCDVSTLYVGVSNVVLQSAVPYRSYTDCACDVQPLEGATPEVERERVDSVSTNGIAKVEGLVQAIKSQKKGSKTLMGKTVAEDPLTGEFYVPTYIEKVTVDYTLEDSTRRFEDGNKVKTFEMKKEAGTWALEKAIDAEKDLVTGEPTLELGVVAQRYPWNGVVDVNYKATFWSRDRQGKIEISVGETVVTTNKLIVGKGGAVTGVTTVDLSKLAPETAGKATFRVVE